MSRERIGILLTGLAEVYGEKLGLDRLRLYLSALSDLTTEQLEEAINEIMRDPRVTRFPLPAAIRARVKPGDDVDSMAIEAANRIWEALARCGHNNPGSAREFIGELGWAVVQRQGGWGEAFSMQTETSDVVGLKAQWRELAKALHARAKAGTLDAPPALPGRSDTYGVLRKSSIDGGERLRELVKGIG
jgi:hypothetical protein